MLLLFIKTIRNWSDTKQYQWLKKTMLPFFVNSLHDVDQAIKENCLGVIMKERIASKLYF